LGAGQIATLRSRNDSNLMRLPRRYAPRNQTVSQLIARFKMGNKQDILPKKEYLKCLFTLIMVLNGKFFQTFSYF
jgi:hypothetical protein